MLIASSIDYKEKEMECNLFHAHIIAYNSA